MNSRWCGFFKRVPSLDQRAYILLACAMTFGPVLCTLLQALYSYRVLVTFPARRYISSSLGCPNPALCKAPPRSFNPCISLMRTRYTVAIYLNHLRLYRKRREVTGNEHTGRQRWRGCERHRSYHGRYKQSTCTWQQQYCRLWNYEAKIY